MRIRRANEADVNAIAEIHVRSWQAAYAGLLPGPALDALSIPDRTKRWRETFDRPPPGFRVWIGEDDELVVGFSSTGPSRDSSAESATAELHTIYLRPDFIGTGRGRALFAHAVDDLRAQGYRAAELWVLVGNERARRFYEAAGWHTDGEEKIETLHGIEVHEIRYGVDL